jgi:hypothetical protein
MSQQETDIQPTEEGPPSDEERIARHLRKRVLEQARGDIDERVPRDFPSERFFAGALAARSSDQLDDPDDDLQSKMEPSALGSTVRVRNGSPDDALVVNVDASVWVRVYPTYEEMRNRESFVALGDRDEDDDGDELLPVFRRLELDVEPIRIPFDELADLPRHTPEVVRERANTALRDAFEDARDQALAQFDVYEVPGGEPGDDEVPAQALASEADFEGYLAEREGVPAIPGWDAELAVSVMPDREDGGEDVLIVDIELTNRAVQSEADGIHTIRDPTLFEVEFELEADGSLEFVPFTFDPLPQDFRYNRDLWGHGRNCTVVAPDEHETLRNGRTPGRRAPEADPSADRLETRYVPQYRQLVYESADRGVDPRFDDLSNLEAGGLEVLEDVHRSMQRYLEEDYPAALDQYREREDWDDDPETGDLADFIEDRKAFEREIARFERGIRCLRQHPETVGRAFECMNETMDRMHDFDSWRLFQLVFIVTQVPDVTAREHDGWDEVEWRDGDTDDRAEEADSALEVVDVLWFPTGGGKTEAFLGVAVWNMFFDRIRGKDFGVTAWTRFPLRLLSLQQLQRMSETIMYADLVRREQPDIGEHPSRSFSVGYLVGKKNTPNQLTGYNNDNYSRYRNDRSLREDAKVVPSCPACDAPVEMRVTDDDHRLAHVCTGSSFDCPWQARDVDPQEPYEEDELPVHVVDNELYRYAPTILAGTIDKITAIGYQRKVAHLLTGEMDCECPIHGFASLGECTEKYGCEIDRDEFEDLATPVEPYDPAPSLMVPDELHLLEESVGSFDGHYETGVDALQDLVDAGTTKIIAPTATITAYEDQVHHLFMRSAERFPAPGPYLRENFYARERAETQRYYIGLVPHGKTHINSIIDLLYYFHEEVQTLLREALENPEALLTGAALEGTDTDQPLETDRVDEVISMLTLYSTSLTYLLSKKDGDRLDQSIVSQLEAYLKRDDRPSLTAKRLTGGTPFEAVQDILDTLEEPWDEEQDEDLLEGLIEQDLVADGTAEGVLDLRNLLERSLNDEDEEVDNDQFRVELRRMSAETREGLAWLLASRLNAITATSMISHGVDVERFNMMVFFGMPRQTAEYIQSSSRAGRTFPGLVFNVAHPIRERDLSHYHFFEKYHEFLDRLVEPVAINRWAKNSVKRTHPGLMMGLLLNHYMYNGDYGNLYFGDQAEEFANSIDEEELADQIAGMYGDDDSHEEFMQDADDLTRAALSQLRLDDSQWTSGRLPRDPMRSLRDVDEQLPIRPEYRDNDIFESFNNR